MNANYSTTSLIALSTLLLLGAFEASASGQEDRAGRESVNSSFRAETNAYKWNAEPTAVPKSKKKKSHTGQSSGNASTPAASVEPIHEGKTQNKSESSAQKKEFPQPSQSPRPNDAVQTSPTPSPSERPGRKKVEAGKSGGHAAKKEEPKPSPSTSPK